MKSIFLFLVAVSWLTAESRVTYEISGGRFGDYTNDFLNGLWVSHKLGLPLLYNPCYLSDELVLSKRHQKGKPKDFTFDQTVSCYHTNHLKRYFQSTLYSVPHFTPFTSDASVFGQCAGRGPYFYHCHLIDWRDKQFLRLAREEVKLINPLPLLEPKEGFHNIALHFREGGDFDSGETKKNFPLKFLPLPFYFSALSDLLSILPPGPIFLALFSDVLNPEKVAQQIREHLMLVFPERESVVEISPGASKDGKGVLIDFFSLSKFHYIIGADTLFSQIAARIGDCRLWLKPELFAFDGSPHRRLFWSLVGYALDYKTFADHHIVSFNPMSGSFDQDLIDIFRRGYFCYQHGYFFDCVLTHPLYKNLRKGWLKPIERTNEMEILEADLPQVHLIDWSDPIFLAQMRELFSYKKVITLPYDKNIPTVSVTDTFKDLTFYFDLVRENGWEHHQLVVILTEPSHFQHKSAKKRQYQLLLRKAGIDSSKVEIYFIDLKDNPVDAFIAVGHSNYVLTTPNFTVEAAAKLFIPQPELILR